MNQSFNYIEHTTGPSPQYTIIWLHGLGADGHDFAPIATQLQLDQACRFIFPHAPMRAISCNNGYVMRGWYDITHFEQIDRQADLAGIEDSRAALYTLVKQENTRGIATDKIILAGFSQGGAMAYMAGLTYDHAFAGLISLSAYIPDLSFLHKAYQPANQCTPIFIGHGLTDTIVPPALGKVAHQAIDTLGNPCCYREYAMAHSVCAQEIADLSIWLKNIIL